MDIHVIVQNTRLNYCTIVVLTRSGIRLFFSIFVDLGGVRPQDGNPFYPTASNSIVLSYVFDSLSFLWSQGSSSS